MSREPANTSKRLENTRSQASGISDLSNLTRSTDDLNDADDRFAVTSRHICNGALRGSRTNVIHAVQPLINSGSQTIPTENRRQRQVSFGRCDNEEETFVKEIGSQSNSPQDNLSDRQGQSSPQSPAEELYSRRQFLPQVCVAPLVCQNITNTSQTSINNFAIPEHLQGEDDLLVKIEEQQKLIDQLTRDKRNTQKLLYRQRVLQRRSVSVTSLRGSPKECVSPVNENVIRANHLYESLPRGSKTNIASEANMNARNENVFVFPSRHNAKITQRRSRSCDVLLDDEESDAFISPHNENSLQVESSVGYEHVTAHSSAASLNRIEDCPDMKKSSHTKYSKFKFRLWFYGLLALNTIIVLMNATGIPIVLRGLNCPKPTAEITCIKCEELNESRMYIDKLVFLEHNNQCCLKSSSQLLELLINVTKALNASHLPPQARKSRRTQPLSDNEDGVETPVAQYKALGQAKIGNFSRIMWDREVQRVFRKLDPEWNNTVVLIPASGYYYIYSRVHYIKSYNEGQDSLSFGHSILIERSNAVDDELGSVDETCFPSRHKVRHTSHLSFVQNLTEGDRMYVRLDKETHFDIGQSKFGLYLVPNKTTPIC